MRDLLPVKEHFLRSQEVGDLSRLLFQTIKTKEGEEEPEKEEKEFHLFRSMLGESSDCVDVVLPNFVLKTRLCYPMPFAKDIYEEYSPRISSKFMIGCIKVG